MPFPPKPSLATQVPSHAKHRRMPPTDSQRREGSCPLHLMSTTFSSSHHLRQGVMLPSEGLAEICESRWGRESPSPPLAYSSLPPSLWTPILGFLGLVRPSGAGGDLLVPSPGCAQTPSPDMWVEPAAGPLRMEPRAWEPKVPCLCAAWAQDLESHSSGF